MSPRPKELRPDGSPIGGACDTKRRYTKRAAKWYAAQARGRGVNLVAYHCTSCHCYHVGHPKGSHSNPRPGAPPG